MFGLSLYSTKYGIPAYNTLTVPFKHRLPLVTSKIQVYTQYHSSQPYLEGQLKQLIKIKQKYFLHFYLKTDLSTRSERCQLGVHWTMGDTVISCDHRPQGRESFQRK